jgi:hypothetical protein
MHPWISNVTVWSAHSRSFFRMTGGAVGGLTHDDDGRYRSAMPRERAIDPLMKKLLKTIEVSLSATEAARDAVQEILKRGADTGIFFAGARTRGAFSPELTPQDKEFLRAVSIRPDR